MPEEIQVVRCYNCKTFQVQIVSSKAKWDCKICGARQSKRKVYAKGSGRDCRAHVQFLNKTSLKGYEEFVKDYETPEENSFAAHPQFQRRATTVENRFADHPLFESPSLECCKGKTRSKWRQFMEVADVEDTNDISQPSKLTSDRQIVEPIMGNYLLENNASNAYKEEDVVRPENPFVNPQQSTSHQYDNLPLTDEVTMDKNSVWSMDCKYSAAACMQNKDSENIDQRKRKPEDVRDNFQSFENTEGKDSQANRPIPSLPKLSRKEDYTSDELDKILSF